MTSAAGDAAAADAWSNEEPASVWEPVVARARQALADGDDAALIALDEEIRTLIEERRAEVRRGLPFLTLYRSLATWKRDGRFDPPFANPPTAKIQLWELDAHCPDLGYQRAFVDRAVTRFGERRGFVMFQRVLSTIGDSSSTFRSDPAADYQVHRRPGAKLTIVGFSGRNHQYAGIDWNLFDRAIAEPLGANLVVFRDHNRRLYLAGIRGMGDYRATVDRVRAMLAEFANTRIVATGGSAGVFGGINIAADIGIRHIVAFAGPTSIEIGEEDDDRQIYRRISADIAAGRYARVDLAQKVNDSAIERIDFFVAGQHEFDMAQMKALRDRCPKVVPHVYENEAGHIVTDFAIADRSIFAAFDYAVPNGLA